jgi:hypothetical protein
MMRSMKMSSQPSFSEAQRFGNSSRGSPLRLWRAA